MLRSEAASGPAMPSGHPAPQPTTARSGVDAAVGCPGRISWHDARFFCILASIVIMSLADLTMTLLHFTGVGMVEENPVARLLMRYGGVCSLCAWKAGTVTIGVFILWKIRNFRAAEVGAWLCFVVLAALCMHWAIYNSQVSGLTTEILSIEKNRANTDWVVLQTNQTP